MRTALLVLVCLTASGQTFEAASVKPFVPQTSPNVTRRFFFGGGRGGPGSSDPGRIQYPMTTIKSLLMTAYDVKDFQISGPDWLATSQFVIEATMPPETTKEQFLIMLQNLLAERFKLTIHRETKDLPMYSMVVAKNGPKMKESAPAAVSEESKDAPMVSPGGRGPLKMGADGFPILPMNFGGRGGFGMLMMPGRARLIAQQQTMQNLAERLSTMLSRPVTDATGLKAKFDFTLTYAPEGTSMLRTLAPPPPPPSGEGGRGPGETPDAEPPQTILLAVQSQLGLKLEPKKGPVDLIVVDHAEKTPTEN